LNILIEFVLFVLTYFLFYSFKFKFKFIFPLGSPIKYQRKRRRRRRAITTAATNRLHSAANNRLDSAAGDDDLSADEERELYRLVVGLGVWSLGTTLADGFIRECTAIGARAATHQIRDSVKAKGKKEGWASWLAGCAWIKPKKGGESSTKGDAPNHHKGGGGGDEIVGLRFKYVILRYIEKF
jgi:hypothetical protein